MFKLFILMISILFFASNAKALELKFNSGTLYVENTNKWEVGENLFGIPFILFSKIKNGQRSNISFAFTGAQVELDYQDLHSTQKTFRENKKKWAKKSNVDVRGFTPYSVKLNKQGHRVHEIGLYYSFQNEDYIEKTFYIECKGNLIFSKALRLMSNDEHDKYFNEFINSMDCS